MQEHQNRTPARVPYRVSTKHKYHVSWVAEGSVTLPAISIFKFQFLIFQFQFSFFYFSFFNFVSRVFNCFAGKIHSPRKFLFFNFCFSFFIFHFSFFLFHS